MSWLTKGPGRIGSELTHEGPGRDRKWVGSRRDQEGTAIVLYSGKLSHAIRFPLDFTSRLPVDYFASIICVMVRPLGKARLG